jgi:hypothetical protein
MFNRNDATNGQMRFSTQMQEVKLGRMKTQRDIH